MGIYIAANDIGSAWLDAFRALNAAHGSVVNLAVDIASPNLEDLGVRHAIEAALVGVSASGKKKFDNPQSMHTVANTIFPISLYRPDVAGAADRFIANALKAEQGRAHISSARRGWGTYLGRLVHYPGTDGQATNQLANMLDQLRAPRHWADRYEMPLVVPSDDQRPCWESSPDKSTTSVGAILHQDTRIDARPRGGPCLAHLSLTLDAGAVSMVALYRRHSYIPRAYGNFVGLARLLAFLARESNNTVGNLMIVTGHAVDDGVGRRELLDAATAAAGTTTPIELSARPLGASWSDLELPKVAP